jgi:hypothetical protein
VGDERRAERLLFALGHEAIFGRHVIVPPLF